MPPESLAPAEVTAYVLAGLALILAATRLVGGAFERYGQPRVVGEMIAGLLIGPTVLGGELARGAVSELGRPAVDGSGLVNDLYPLQAFSVLGQIGTLTLVLFMLMIGLGVRTEALRGRGTQIGIVAAAVVLVPVALGFALGAILDEPGRWRLTETLDGEPVTATTHALFIGAALAVTAFPIMSRVMQEKRMLETPVGAIGVGTAAVVTPLMFIVLAAATASAAREGVPETVAVKLALAAGLAVVVLGPVRRLYAHALEPRHDPDDPAPARVLALLLIGALAAGLAADRIGVHALTGGFLLGLAVPRLPGLTQAAIEAIRPFVLVFLMPVFVALAGIQTDLTVLRGEHVAGIALLLVTLLAAKWGAGAVACRAVGLDWRQSNLIGVLLNCRGLMILVVALLGKEAGVITDPMLAALMAGAIVTTLMTGPLVDRFLPPEASERARDASITGSLSAVAAMTGGPRVLVSLPEGSGGEALAAARPLLDVEGPRAQCLLAALPAPAEGGDYVGAGPEEAGAAVAAAQPHLEAVAEALRAGGVDASVVSFQTPTPTEDLARLAAEWAASAAVTGSSEEAAQLRAAGIETTLAAPSPAVAP